jgi:hypothetical protein
MITLRVTRPLIPLICASFLTDAAGSPTTDCITFETVQWQCSYSYGRNSKGPTRCYGGKL